MKFFFVSFLMYFVSAQTSILSMFSNQPSALAIDSNTLYIAAGNLVKSYNPNSGDDLKKDFIGHTAPINSILLSGNSMFTASQDRTIRQWETSTGKAIRTFNGHTEEVWKVVIDGNNLISGGGDESIRIFDLSTGQLVRTIENAHHQRVASLAVTKDYLYTAGFDSLAKEWSKSTWQNTRTFTGHIQGIWDIAVQNSFLYTASDDNVIKRWDLTSGKDIHSYQGHGSHIKCIKVIGNDMFTGGYDYRIIHWNIDTGEILESIQEQASYISSIAVDSNGGFLYASSADNSVKKWKVSLQKLNSTVTVDDGLATTATTKNNGATKSMFYNIFMGLVFLFQ